MKRFVSVLSILLCMILTIHSLPVSAIADMIVEDTEQIFEEITDVQENTTSTAPYILGEITEERTLDTKIFRMSDGSYTAAVYPTQVHYEENGEMKEIDYRFEEVTVDGKSFFETKAGPISLRVPETLEEGTEVLFASGEHSIAFSLSAIEGIEAQTLESSVDTTRLESLRETVFAELLTDEKFEELYSKAKAEADVLDIKLSEAIEEISDIMMSAPGATSAVKYESVMNGIDLNYSLSGTMLKEEIILNRQASALKTFSFTLCTGDLIPVLNTDKSVSLNNSEGEEKLKIAAPFMFDAVGAESTDIDVSLVENGDGTYTYKLMPDKKWLGSAARIYPVTIDPPVTDSSFYTVKDTTGVFASSVGNLSSTSEKNYLKVGKRYDSSTGTTSEVQAMIYSQLPDAINSTTNIVHAYLYLHEYRGSFSSCPNDMRLNAYMITSDWNTSNVMENEPIALGSDDRSDETNILDYVYYNDSTEEEDGKTYQFEITEAAQKWLDGTNTNYGISIRASGLGSTESFARFFDSTHTAIKDDDGETVITCPKMVYVYRDSKGIENYWSFTSMEAGRTGVAAVNNYNGNLVTVHDLVSSTGNNMPVSVSIIYSANSTDNGSAGMGMWRTNYHMKVETCNLSFSIPGAETINYKYCFRDADGTKHYLKEEGSEHKDEDGLGLTLTTADGSVTGYYYKIETKDHTEYQFDFYGRLTKIVDSNGNYNKVVYEAGSGSDSSKNRILYIDEGSDMSTATRRTTFALDSATGDITVTSPEGNWVKLDFLSATNRMLQSIKYEDNINTAFTFTLIGAGYFPTKITDGKGHQTTISYISGASKRAVALQWGTSTTTLQQYVFTYGHNSTKVVDIEGRATTLQFNGYGQTIGIVDHTSSIGQSYEFGAPGGTGIEEGKENKLLLTSKTIYATENRMSDGGFNSSSSVNSYSVYPSSTGVTKNYEGDKEGNTGTGRMKLTKAANCSDVRFIYQSISGLAVGKYTLSAYISTNGNSLNGSGAQLTVNIFNSSGYRNGASSNSVTYTKEGEWIRLQKTVQIVSGDTRVNVGITLPANTTGTIYVDDIQFEHNISGGAGSFNQLNNSSLLNSLSSWGGSGGFSSSYKDFSAPAGLKYVASVAGDPAVWKTLTQEVEVDGKKDDVFIAGAWAKANSVPVYQKSEDDSTYNNSENKKGRPEFGLHITFYNGGTKVGDTFEAQFNSGTEDWQFLTDKVIAPGDYTKVVYTFIYGYNTGNASVATPFLYKESYGQSYVYDREGNVTSSTDVAETEASFAYQDDVLTQSLSPTGSRYMYANDDTSHNTTYAVSNSGQKISFGYNGSGDATSMYINDVEYITELSRTTGEKVNCYLVNAKNGRVLEPHAMSAGNYVYAKNFGYNTSEMWQLQYLSGDIYTIRCLSDTTLGLTTLSSSDGYQIGTVNSSNVPFKFAITPNGDGTFKISTEKSNHTQYLYQSDSLHYSGSNSYVLRTAEYDENDPAFKWHLVATTSGGDKMKTSADYGTDGLHLMSSTDAVGNVTSYTYGSNGLVATVTDPEDNVTNYTYDNMDRTSTVESGTSKVEYTYDKDLLKNILVDDGLVQYSFDYDSFGRKTAVYVGNGTEKRTLASYLYDDRLLERQTYGSTTNYIDFEYDSLDRLIKKTYNGDASKYIQYLYDPNGNQYGVIDNIWGKNTLFEYDLASRTNGVGVFDPNGIMRSYQSIRYNDGKGTIESIMHSMFNALGVKLRTTNYSYVYGDAAEGEIPDTIYKYTAGNADFTFTYDDLARLVNRTLTMDGVSTTESYTYLANKTDSTYKTTLVGSMTDLAGKTHTYTYDKNGNILTDTYDGNTVSYEYDNLNRMTRFNDPVFGWTYVYVYDDRGNITEMQEHHYTDGTLGEPLHTYEYEYGDSTWADLMTSYWGEEIVYDELGNPLNWINGETLTWQNGRQLASVNGLTYGYNADGLRVSKTGANGFATEYYVVNGQYIGEVTTINGTEYVISYVYDENGTVAGINVNGTEYYFVKNIQGDVLSIIDTTGTVVANYHYDAYGYIISVTDANGRDITSATHIAHLNPFRYRGYMYDEESGFYYLRSRYYEPFIGRFLNADGLVSTGQGLDGNNMFAYCGNNPVMRADTSGQFWEIVVLVVVIVACVALTSCSKKTAPDPIEPEDTTAGSTSSTTTGTVETKPPTPGYNDYLDALGARESSDNYSSKKGQYLGRYQMGNVALQDAGFKDSSGNWTDLANSYGVYNSNDFLNSPQAQDVAVTKFNMKVCGYIKHYGLDSYIGSEYCGVTVTQSGLLAACHLVGIGTMKDALNSGVAVWDDNGTHASEYMDMFGGYDISEVW